MNLVIAPVPNRTAKLIEALRLQMGRTQVRPGCIECHISQDVEEENIVHYQEAWNSWDDLEKHILSERFSWILELMEQSSNTPSLSFNDVHETRGMEYVKRLRKVGHPN
ncbi:MAG TPA: antibiotic biosynthesis monooxygenase [Acidobacteriota bacterium]|nr:antibiotic biosynthesis monooxygenase [Acidobacteriota bacterium]